jgi:hypothetical protein
MSVLSYFQVLVKSHNNAMDMLDKLPNTIITVKILPYLNLSEVTELRALNKTIKDILSMKRRFIIAKCFHMLPHGLEELLNADGWLTTIWTFKEGKKHGEEREYGIGYDPLLFKGGLRRVTPLKEGKKHGVEKHYSKYGVLIRTATFIEGQKHGEEKRFFCLPFTNCKGVMITTPFTEGQKHGVEQYFRQEEDGLVEGGVLLQTSSFKEGRLHGEEKSWNTKGVLTQMPGGWAKILSVWSDEKSPDI